MREEVKTRLAGAGAALATSVNLAALQAGHLGGGNFALQVTATLIVLSWAPYLYRTALLASLPNFLSIPLFLVWFCLCFGPVLVATIINLFTGHRVPGAQWYDALWRIYAILAVWMGFAVLNERFIRPWWRENSGKYLKFARKNSVSAQARQMAVDKRAAALEAIKSRVVVVLKKKKLSERIIEDKKCQVVKAKENVEKAENVLQKAKERIGKCDPADKESAEEEADAMAGMVESARDHEKGLHREIARAELDLEDIASQMAGLQHEWTEALHIQNYTAFYR